MGIAFNRKPNHYNSTQSCIKRISLQPALKALTQQNIRLLKSLGLKVKRGGGKGQKL